VLTARGLACPSIRWDSVLTAISLVISDVDGTLVTPDKEITPASVRAVYRLADRGIGFTVVSSRPPAGLRMLVEPLSLSLPMGAFSGATIVDPDLATIEEHVIPAAAARRSVAMLSEAGADVWIFTADGWLIRNADGAYVAKERRTILAEPIVVADFSPHLARAFKVVGSSRDFARLAECETAIRAALGGEASVALSQPYYLDITPPGRDKGTFVEALSRQLAVPPSAIAVLGDMTNDLAMFRKAGLSIAMGNATDAVKACATHATAANTDDGFAKAIDAYVLGAAL
jgi:Cof subfamily protein (haloacid dehalogenase superfamily)